ncbi:hypothetical protein PHYBOEH_002792 [Phytophthora boehmeriae]|uniref:Uncharacterized protein n=1 Tax=Phytophthora boehmeriae TaxID=109152 RepID=A0A8T1WWZ1_9STRA|nr:hypothetical protein PHYBOEH_002792 [Phytophthora boehmeriae]
MCFRSLLRWVRDLLDSLRKLVSENVQHLLRALTKTTRKVATNIDELLRKLCSLLRTHAPLAVAKAMVDFNRWIVEVLADTRSEGIEWEPSYGENPWLALEEQPQNPSLEEDLQVGDAHTLQLLKAIAEFYMVRCDSLLDANTRLAMQVDELKNQLNDAQTQAFESQQVVEHQHELLKLQVYRHLIGVQTGEFLAKPRPSSAASVDVTTQTVVAVPSEAVQTHCEVTEEIIDEMAPANVASASNEAEDIASETSTQPDEVGDGLSPSEDGQELVTTASIPASTPDSSGVSFQQLTKMRTSDQDGSWLRETLRVLQAERKQRRLARGRGDQTDESSNPVSTPSNPTTTTPSLHDITPEPMEFEQLVSTRDPAQADEDSKWYRSALSHLRQERRRRSTTRSRTASLSSTITITD